MRDRVAVVGDGPAGAALAAACAEVGLPTVLVGAAPDRVWPATYGAWVDELAGVDGIGGAALWRHRFPDPLVGFDGMAARGLGRPYGVVDNGVLHRALRERLLAAGGEVITGRVLGAEHDARGSRVLLAPAAGGTDGEGARGGAGAAAALPRRPPRPPKRPRGDRPRVPMGRSALDAGLVVDATGHRPALVAPGSGRPPGWQVAYGVVGPLERAPVPQDGMWFMDWRAIPGVEDGGRPTFLYAMDIGGGRTFVEETSLAARPAVAMGVVQARLAARLAAAGTRVVAEHAVERVAFPMGGPLPAPQRVVAYGAAAGMVHPATGFQVAAALRRAPAVASALAEALRDPTADPEAVAARGWEAVWPADAVRQRALHAYGLEILLEFDRRDVQRFFAAFFDLPAADWRAYLSGAGSAGELARIMVAVARRLPAPLAWRVTRGAVGGDGLALLRAAMTGRG